MDLSSPISSVIPSVHGLVLAVLARTEVGLSGRRVAMLTHGRASQHRVNQVLGELAESGIVIKESHPSMNLYQLNRDHLAADAIVVLAHLTHLLIERITNEAEAWPVKPEAVWLFGSVARGDGDPGSDIDVAVVRSEEILPEDPSWIHQLDELAVRVRSWTGNPCEILEFGENELADLAAADDPIVVSLQRESIPVLGDSASRWLAAVVA